MQDLTIDPSCTLPATALSWTAERASGPGGQHVNKTSTAVELRFDLHADHGLAPAVVARLRAIAGKRVGGDGVLILVAMEHRSQLRNLDTALTRLAELVRRALVPPEVRHATKVPRYQKVARLTDKRLHSARKRMRTDRGGDS